jgi:hypothetical protein
VTNRAAKALAAFEGRSEVTAQDIFQVIPLCLRHRLRKDPLETIDSGEKCKTCLKKVLVKTCKVKVVVIFFRIKIDFYKCAKNFRPKVFTNSS